jgi:hypothetical protein
MNRSGCIDEQERLYGGAKTIIWKSRNSEEEARGMNVGNDNEHAPRTHARPRATSRLDTAHEASLCE